jgi:hypothetical protein
MDKLITILKGWIFDKGAKAVAGTGAVAILLALFDRLAEGKEPAHFCFTLDATGGMMVVAGLVVLLAFKSPPPGSA